MSAPAPPLREERLKLLPLLPVPHSGEHFPSYLKKTLVQAPQAWPKPRPSMPSMNCAPLEPPGK